MQGMGFFFLHALTPFDMPVGLLNNQKESKWFFY